LGVSRAAVFKVVTAYTNHGKTSSAERDSGRKPKLSEGDRRTLKRIMSKNHRNPAVKVTAKLSTHPELNAHFEDPVSLQIVRGELHKFNIHSTAAIAIPLITENNAKSRKRWHDHKTRTYDDWKYVIWSDESFFTMFPTLGRVCIWRTPKEAIILNAWFQLRNMEAHS